MHASAYRSGATHNRSGVEPTNRGGFWRVRTPHVKAPDENPDKQQVTNAERVSNADQNASDRRISDQADRSPDAASALSPITQFTALSQYFDVFVVADDRLRVEEIVAFGPEFDPYGHSLVELALPESQAALRRAAERCMKGGEVQSVVAKLKQSPLDHYLLKLVRTEASDRSLILAGVATRSPDLALADNERQRVNHLDKLLDAMPIAAFIKDTDGRFRWANQSFIDSIGAVGRDDILGRSDFDFLNEEDAAKYAADDQWIIKTGKGIKLQEELNSRATGQLEVLSTTKFLSLIHI